MLCCLCPLYALQRDMGDHQQERKARRASQDLYPSQEHEPSALLLTMPNAATDPASFTKFLERYKSFQDEMAAANDEINAASADNSQRVSEFCIKSRLALYRCDQDHTTSQRMAVHSAKCLQLPT